MSKRRYRVQIADCLVVIDLEWDMVDTAGTDAHVNVSYVTSK